MVLVPQGVGEGLVPVGVQALVHHFALVELLPFDLELHVGVAGGWNTHIDTHRHTSTHTDTPRYGAYVANQRGRTVSY